MNEAANVEVDTMTIYRHYKGQCYYLICVTTDANTGQQSIVYRNVRDSVFRRNGYCTRPVEDFYAPIPTTQCTRFTKMPAPTQPLSSICGGVTPAEAAVPQQTRKQSLQEILMDTAVGFMLAMLITIGLSPYFDLTTGTGAFLWTLLFTGVSLARRYTTRRYFNGVPHA